MTLEQEAADARRRAETPDDEIGALFCRLLEESRETEGQRSPYGDDAQAYAVGAMLFWRGWFGVPVPENRALALAHSAGRAADLWRPFTAAMHALTPAYPLGDCDFCMRREARPRREPARARGVVRSPYGEIVEVPQAPGTEVDLPVLPHMLTLAGEPVGQTTVRLRVHGLGLFTRPAGSGFVRYTVRCAGCDWEVVWERPEGEDPRATFAELRGHFTARGCPAATP